MKFKWLLFLLLFVWLPTFAAYQQQGFIQFQELDGNVDFVCTGQCVAVISPLAWSDYLALHWTLQGNGMIWYGFLVGQQIMPGENIQINGDAVLNQQFFLSKLPFYSQIPPEAQIVLIAQGNITWYHIWLNLWLLNVFEKLSNGFKDALQYKEYNPRTINFLEWPMWNGRYINQVFFWFIIIWLLFAVLWYFFSQEKKQKRNAISFGVWFLVFFRVFFDMFSTINQVKIYNQTMSATNIMENGRVGRSSDFYLFLDFIKTNMPTWKRCSFIASYPFDFEGKYHMYPYLKFWSITWVQCLFYYNPYWPNNWFWFLDPTYSSGILLWNDLQFEVQKEIIWKPYAKIYLLKDK